MGASASSKVPWLTVVQGLCVGGLCYGLLALPPFLNLPSWMLDQWEEMATSIRETGKVAISGALATVVVILRRWGIPGHSDENGSQVTEYPTTTPAEDDAHINCRREYRKLVKTYNELAQRFNLQLEKRAVANWEFDRLSDRILSARAMVFCGLTMAIGDMLAVLLFPPPEKVFEAALSAFGPPLLAICVVSGVIGAIFSVTAARSLRTRLGNISLRVAFIAALFVGCASIATIGAYAPFVLKSAAQDAPRSVTLLVLAAYLLIVPLTSYAVSLICVQIIARRRWRDLVANEQAARNEHRKLVAERRGTTGG